MTQLYSIIHSKPIHVGGATPEVLVRQEPLLVSERICKSAFDQAFHLTMGSSQSSEKREQKRQVNQSKNTKQSGRGGRPRGQTQRRGVGVHDNWGGGGDCGGGGDGGGSGGGGGGDCGSGGGGVGTDSIEISC